MILVGTNMIEIEFPNPETTDCDCCGKTNTRLTRFITHNGEAAGIYYAAFSDGHPDCGVVGIISLGEWWHGLEGVPESRVAFAFHLWFDGEQFQVMITDALESPWKDANIIGRKLSREEGLRHPWVEEVFHITDHITTQDPAIIDFFAEETIH